MVIVVAIASVTAQAQPKAQFKNSQNQEAFTAQPVKTTHHAAYAYTTATLMESGSSLPMAAKNGLTLGANTPDNNTPLSLMPRPRRVGEDGGFEGEGEDPEDLPGEPNPVGDGVWVMMLLAMCYAFGKWRYQMMWRIMASRSSGEE